MRWRRRLLRRQRRATEPTALLREQVELGRWFARGGTRVLPVALEDSWKKAVRLQRVTDNGCVYLKFSSRTCERGANGCVTKHDLSAPEIDFVRKNAPIP